MSYWTHINGTIEVSPMGRTQAETRYILETVLDHLPRVTGSEANMDIYIIQEKGCNVSSSHTEFGVWGGFLGWDEKNLSLETQSKYVLVVKGALRDRMFEQTYREFQNWLCRLAKRIRVFNVMVEIKSYNRTAMIRNRNGAYTDMFEDPTWAQDEPGGEPNWCEYLMWDRVKGSDYPMMLAYKYYRDEENDREVERRLNYMRGD